MRVSIIIPTYHRPERIAACLAALEHLNYPTFEVIVVDDGSPVPVQSGPRPYPLQILRQPNAGPAAARNRGAAAAQGELLAFLDDDCRPHPGWLTALTAAWQKGALVGGATRNACPQNPYSTFNQQLLDSARNWFRQHSSPLDFLPSNNLLVEADAYRRLHGFGESYPLAAAEDRDLCARWLQDGGTFRLAPDAWIDHDHPQTFASFLRMHYSYGRGAAIFHSSRGTHPGQFAASSFYFYLWQQTRALTLLVLSQSAVVCGYAYQGARPWILPFFAYLLLACASQFQSGAWHADLSGPDEVPHFVNGVVVRQYLVDGLPQSPLAFARDYYQHYPKIAIGHWPPLYSILQGLWFLIASPSPFTALLPIAFIFAALSTIVYRQLADHSPAWLAFATGALMLILPLGRDALHEVMLEPICALLLAFATLAFAGFRFASFGLWSAIALLTKANAGAAALVPPLAIFLGNRWRLLLTFRFWTPVAIVGVLAFPWYWFAGPYMAGEWVPGPAPSFAESALRAFRFAFLSGMAPLPLTLILLALAGWWLRRKDASAAAWASLAVAVLLFHTVVSPHGESRFYLSATAPILILAGSALARLRLAALPVLLGLAILSGNPLVTKPDYGATALVQQLRAASTETQPVALLAGDTEGPVIAEFVQQEPRPNWYLLRASKVLASSTWIGLLYESRFETPAQLAAYLDLMPFTTVIIDTRPAGEPLDQVMLREVLRTGPWRIAARHPSAIVYARTTPAAPAGPTFRNELETRVLRRR